METKRERDPRMWWTNERHMDYLNSMEVSFVQTMLKNNGSLLRLDRYVPDSSESTLDLKLPERRRRRRHSSSSDIHIPYPKTRTDMKTKRPSSQPHTSSQDQVRTWFLNLLEMDQLITEGEAMRMYSLTSVAPAAN
ncbi:hypothetical protein RHSIM_Rhsim09G0197400 [Rhododendron simsii]|uniref:Uncharacterized protein n=1 Tax=Rhododendron simsii TaxID=118357 RepID=A0A834GLE5_RHOSS|nr:hypothetical protein RHSIM_Rhsim09G0197400 [Rhododendron simsii]